MKKSPSKKTAQYLPARPFDNASAIRNGELHVLVDFLDEIGRLARELRPAPLPDPTTPLAMLLEQTQWAGDFARALYAHRYEKKPKNRPARKLTITQLMQAARAAEIWRAKARLGWTDRKAAEFAMQETGCTKRRLDDALKGKLPKQGDEIELF